VFVLPFARGIGFRALVTESELPILSALVRGVWRDHPPGPR
jgi:hypothetical protein